MVWFLPVVPHPVVVWEVVVNTDCEMWSHRDGFPGSQTITRMVVCPLSIKFTH